MKQIVFLITLLTLALADKPAQPVYKASTTTVDVKASLQTDQLQERQDNYGAPAAPAAAADDYGAPKAPVQDSYGSPQAAPVEDSYGSPKADPVAAPQAQGSVGTQGYYYYYYPVASSPVGGSTYGHKTGTSNSGGGGGLLSGGLLVPIVLGLGLLVLLAIAAASIAGNGRSFWPDLSLAALTPYADELAVSVYDALKVYANLQQVEEVR